MNCSTPGLPVHHQLPEFTQTHVHRVSDAIQPSHPLLSPSPPALNPSQQQSLFQWVNSSQKWPKYWSFSFSIIPSKEIPGLISFIMEWLDLLAVQGTLKSFLQHHSSKASILRCSAFFTVQLSYPYMTTGKTIALTRQTFVGKVMSLLLNMLSRLVLALQTDYFSLKDWKYSFLTGRYNSLNKYLQSLNKHLPDTVLATIKQAKMWKIYSPSFLSFKVLKCISLFLPINVSPGGIQSIYLQFSSVQSLSCVWLCDPMNCSMPGLPVHHQLPEFTQTHVHRVSDAIQPSHPLLSPSPPAPNPSQPQSLFQGVNSSHEVAKVLEFEL